MTLKNAEVMGNQYVGALIGASSNGKTEVSGVTVMGTISLSGSYSVGGLMGHGFIAAQDCHVIGNGDAQALIKNTGYHTGGIVGFTVEGGCKFSECSVEKISIESGGSTGGIAGTANYGTEFSESAVNEVSIHSTGSALVGLIAGANQASNSGSVKILDCTTEGTTAEGKDGKVTGKVAMSDLYGNSASSYTIVGRNVVFDNGSGKVISGTLEHITQDQLADNCTLVKNPDGTYKVETLTTDNAAAVVTSAGDDTMPPAMPTAMTIRQIPNTGYSLPMTLSIGRNVASR